MHDATHDTHHDALDLGWPGPGIHSLVIALLAAFPLGLFVGAALSDTVALIADASTRPLLAFWLIAAGVVVGLGAAAWGLLAGLEGHERWLPRRDLPLPADALTRGLSWSTAALSLVGGAVGAQLVHALGLGVSHYAAG